MGNLMTRHLNISLLHRRRFFLLTASLSPMSSKTTQAYAESLTTDACHADAVNRTVPSSNPVRGAKTYPLRELSAFWFYKRGCQEKKLPRELEAAKSSGIQPPSRCAGALRRSSVSVVLLRGHKFSQPSFPSY